MFKVFKQNLEKLFTSNIIPFDKLHRMDIEQLSLGDIFDGIARISDGDHEAYPKTWLLSEKYNDKISMLKQENKLGTVDAEEINLALQDYLGTVSGAGAIKQHSLERLRQLTLQAEPQENDVDMLGLKDGQVSKQAQQKTTLGLF